MKQKVDASKAVDQVLRHRTKPSVPLLLTYMDELEKIWGKRWGAQSEIGKLEEVLVRRPGPEISPPTGHLKWYQLRQQVDWKKSAEEVDALVEILKAEGVRVHFLEPSAESLMKGPYGVPHQKMTGVRDPGLVINGGAIVGRMSLPYRKGDECFWARKIVEIGCPILYSVHRNGIFEGGNVVWLDPEHVCIGVSPLTNQEGVKQVTYVMEMNGVKEVRVVPIPGWLDNMEWPAGGWAHLDCVFGFVDKGLAVLYPAGVPYDFIQYLREKDINLLEAPPDEAMNNACNILAIEPGKVIMMAGNQETQRKIEKEGVEVIAFDAIETGRRGGGPHCLTAPLIRQPGPRVD